VTASGNILAAGYAGTTIAYFSPQQDGHDALLAEFDPDGALLWSQTYGDTNAEAFHALAVTADGDILAAGYSTPGVSLNIPIEYIPLEALLVKIAPDGAVLWAKTYGSAHREAFLALAVSADGSVYAAKSSSPNPFATDPDPDPINSNDYDAILTKLTPDGDLVWTRAYGDANLDQFNALAITADGNIVAAGYTDSADGDFPPSHGLHDALLAKITPDGDLLWARVHGGGDDDVLDALAITGDGNIVAAGNTRSGDGDLPPSHGGAAPLLVKLTPDGELV
jgi:hypothetical protein